MTTVLADNLAVRELFPSDIELGDLKIFTGELLACFEKCVKEKESAIGSADQSGSVAVFLPILLHKLFDLSKYSVATFIKDQKNIEEKWIAQRNTELKEAIYLKYPILQRKVAIACQNWLNNTMSILCRWDNDKEDIAKAIFKEQAPKTLIGNIINLGSAKGDEHEGGQQSLILELSCGRKISYKCRNLSLEQNFYIFAKQLGFAELYQPQYLIRDDYGWMEYIPQSECTNKAQIGNYYYHSGLLLSLLYALEAEDIHHENVIARGPQPVIIDLETLFHHRDDSTKSIDNQEPCISLGNHTVLKTHFIPQYLSLASEQELAAIFPVYDGETPDRNSIPKFHSKLIPVNDYIEEFIVGFETGYSRIFNNKLSLTSSEGPLTVFNGCSARYVCRPTQTYARLIQAASHPNYLLSNASELLLSDKLIIDVEDRQFLDTLVNSEKSSLLRAEIPRFTHRVDQNVLCSNGEKRVQDFFNLPGIQLCQTKIGNMGHSDLVGQVRLIKHSFGLVNPYQAETKPKIVVNSGTSFQALCETTALSIGQFIVQEAIPHQNGKIWTLSKNDGQGRICLEPINSSLFDGYVGILLFLAHLQSRFSTFEKLDLQINHTQILLEQAVNNDKVNQSSAGFSGLGGLLYALGQFKKLWPQALWLESLAQRTLKQLSALVLRDKQPDIVGGSAGAILSLLSYFKQTDEKQALEIACQFADNLITQFQTKGQIGWQTDKDKVLTGFAHGNAGIAYALMQLSKFCENTQLFDYAIAAMKFESEQYMPEIGNWPDRRFSDDDEQKQQAMTAWCHGVIGIGISRLGLKNSPTETLPDFFDRDIKRALSHIFRHSHINNDGLCHGNFGNFELLCLAKEHGMLDAEKTKQAKVLITERVNFISKNGLINMGLSGFTSYSLMNGWAGIGYQLLRFSQPKTTPNILLLDG